MVSVMQDARDISLKFDTLCGLCQDAAEEIRRQQNLLVVSHVDADGLTAAAIICTALERLNIDYKPLFFRQLDLGALDEVVNQGADLVIFTDLGSGMIQEICDRSLVAVVTDHHKPAACAARPLAHINPHLGERHSLCHSLLNDPPASCPRTITLPVKQQLFPRRPTQSPALPASLASVPR